MGLGRVLRKGPLTDQDVDERNLAVGLDQKELLELVAGQKAHFDRDFAKAIVRRIALGAENCEYVACREESCFEGELTNRREVRLLRLEGRYELLGRDHISAIQINSETHLLHRAGRSRPNQT